MRATRPRGPSIAVVGERTTGDGPFLDDHFLILVRHDGSWTQHAFDAPETASILESLRRETGTPLRRGLANRTEEASRVLSPPALAGRELFVLEPAGGAASRLLGRSILRLADRVEAWIRSPQSAGSLLQQTPTA